MSRIRLCGTRTRVTASVRLMDNCGRELYWLLPFWVRVRAPIIHRVDRSILGNSRTITIIAGLFNPHRFSLIPRIRSPSPTSSSSSFPSSSSCVVDIPVAVVSDSQPPWAYSNLTGVSSSCPQRGELSNFLFRSSGAMRALLRPLAAQAAHNPIETIVVGFILATLSYFHVLGAIKASTFLSPTSTLAVPNLRPAHALFRDSRWIAVDEEIWHTSTGDRFELQQVVFDTTDSALRSSLTNTSTGAVHSTVSTTSSSTTLTLVSPPLGAQKRTSAIPNVPEYKFVLEQPAQHLAHGRWVAYAFRSLITRFISLASQAHSLDILLVLAGYVLMHTTFFRLLVSSRSLGSNFWLTAGILTSSTLAFVLSLPLALHLGIPVDPVLLTEALPFLVCTVGFDKPLRLGRAVFTHEHLFTPISTTSDSHIHPGSRGRSSHTNTQMKPAPLLLLEALDRVGNAVLRDYALEIFVLLVGASSKVGGLREMCALAAVILGMDCLMSVTFYIAVMGVMVEVSFIHNLFVPFLCSVVPRIYTEPSTNTHLSLLFIIPVALFRLLLFYQCLCHKDRLWQRGPLSVRQCFCPLLCDAPL